MTMLDIHSHMFLRNLIKVMAGKKFRLYTFREYLELQHTDNNNGYSVIIKEDSWKGVNLYIEHNDAQVYFKGNYITETRLLNAVEESLNAIEEAIIDLAGQIAVGKIETFEESIISDSFLRKLKLVTSYLGATVEQGWGVNVKNPKGSILILPSTDVRGVKLAVYDNEDREIRGWANYLEENTALKAVDEILTIGVLATKKSEEVQEDKEPKPKYANLEMMKRSQDFIISEEGDEILVDFVAFYVPYYATIKDGEITYSINTIDAEDEHIKLDMDKLNQLKEVCEFIIG